jgi:hypothetical protein
MRRVLVTALLFAGGVATLPSPLLAAQPAAQPPAAAAPSVAPSPAGRWEGKLATPMQTLDLTVDIMAKGSGWEGVITIPAQNLTQYPLSSVTASGDSASFAMAAPGNPQFTGKVDASVRTWTGEFTQGGGKLPLTLTRTGDAKIDPPKPSTAIDKALEGTWEGTLDVNGRTLRLVLKLSSAEGLGKGTLTSVDQGNAEIPVQTVSQTGPTLTLLLPAIAGSWEGQLKGEQLEGTWKQGAGSLPLTFKRAAAK